MPPRAKAADTADTELVTPSPAPAKAEDVCATCGQGDLDPSTTGFTCEHGTWVFVPVPKEPEAPEPSDQDRLSAVLASLTTDQLQALLAAKAEGSQQ